MNHVVIVDDHEVCLNTMRHIIHKRGDIESVHTFTIPSKAIEYIKFNTAAVNFLITDLSMTGIDGIKLIKEVKRYIPDIRILVFSMHEESGIIHNVLGQGINAYVLKTSPLSEINEAISAVLAGGSYYSARISSVLCIDKNKKSKLAPDLTKRELEILKLIIDEKTTAEIARELNLSESTIETYRQSLLFKFDCKNSVGMVAKAYQYGML